MSSVLTLRPDNVREAGATIVVGGDRALVLADNSDGTYNVGLAVGDSRPYLKSVYFSDAALPANARVEWVRPRARVAMVGNYDQRFAVWLFDAGGAGECVVVRDGAAREWIGDALRGSPLTAKDWTDSELDQLWMTLWMYDVSFHPGGDIYLYELYLDVSYKRAGSVVVNPPADLAVTRPTITWTPSAPDNTAQPQEKFIVRVYSEDQYDRVGFTPLNQTLYPSTWDSGIVYSSTQRSILVGARLVNHERYRAYVFAAQPWPGTDGTWFNPTWAYTEFVINAPALALPELVSVIADADNARVAITTGSDYAPGGADPAFYEVERSEDGGATWTTLAESPAAGGAAVTIYDHQATRNRDLLFRLRAVTSVNQSEWTVHKPAHLVISGWWLKATSNPSLNRRVTVVDTKHRRTEPQEVSYTLGAAEAIVTSDGVKGWGGTLTIQMEGEEENLGVEAILFSGDVLLLQDVHGRQHFIRSGETQEYEVLRSIPRPDEPQFPVRYLRRVTFDWTEVRAP